MDDGQARLHLERHLAATLPSASDAQEKLVVNATSRTFLPSLASKRNATAQSVRGVFQVAENVTT
jgi:hypothetical protein